MYSIYRLIDPRDNCIYYIGYSMDVKTRYHHHCLLHKGALDKVRWVKELKKFNLLPVLSILEEVADLTEARKREAQWIERYAELGEPLTNGIFPLRKGVKTVDVNYFKSAHLTWRHTTFAESYRNERREREKQAVTKT